MYDSANMLFPAAMARAMSTVCMDSINDQTYRGILQRGDSYDARRAVGLEDSITAFSRHRYTSHSKDDNVLSSLVATHGYIEGGGSLYSAPSQNSLNANKEEVDVRMQLPDDSIK